MSFLGLFTKIQEAKLQKAGFESLYDFLTYFPTNLTNLVPISYLKKYEEMGGVMYLIIARIQNVRKVLAGKRYYIFETDDKRIPKIYYFKFYFGLDKSIKTGQEYQFILKKKDNFWIADRFALFNNPYEGSFNQTFILGKSQISQYLIPRYPKVGSLTSNQILNLHQKIPDNLYNFSLEGMFPKNSLLDWQLDILNIHKPKSQKEYLNSSYKWDLFQSFLVMSRHKYLKLKQKSIDIESPVLNLKYLQDFTSSLPYKLTDSQKKLIWDILKKITKTEVINKLFYINHTTSFGLIYLTIFT